MGGGLAFGTSIVMAGSLTAVLALLEASSSAGSVSGRVCSVREDPSAGSVSGRVGGGLAFGTRIVMTGSLTAARRIMPVDLHTSLTTIPEKFWLRSVRIQRRS